jgi:UDP-N-acetylglucosamine--N-acetylmuramyl-(pentapeptide) pyrophosphoryl-undecaprenol N-acetylglucosamine transferase
VYPALAVHSALMNDRTLVETLWVGGEGGMEAALVERAGIPFKAIPAAGLHGVGLRNLPRNLGLMTRGVGASRRILKEFRPDTLLFTGGYVAVPMALAGRKTPSLVYVPDIEPGLSLKTVARFADRIAVSAEDSRRFFPSRAPVVVTGYPVRASLGQQDKAPAQAALGLDPTLPTLLISGGSRGARSINLAVLQHLENLLDLAQIVHVSGDLDWPAVEAAHRTLDAARAAHYHPYPYLHQEMPLALAAADLAIWRAGASSLGELPAVGLPAILVPYPYAWRYQKVNADYLASRGAALVLEDGPLPDQLLPTVESLLGSPERLAGMRRAMRGLARPDAAALIARQIRQLGGEQ